MFYLVLIVLSHLFLVETVDLNNQSNESEYTPSDYQNPQLQSTSQRELIGTTKTPLVCIILYSSGMCKKNDSNSVKL